MKSVAELEREERRLLEAIDAVTNDKQKGGATG